MLTVTLHRPDPAVKAAIEDRLNSLLPSKREIESNWSDDYTAWAVSEMTDAEFDAVKEIFWEESPEHLPFRVQTSGFVRSGRTNVSWEQAKRIVEQLLTANTLKSVVKATGIPYSKVHETYMYLVSLGAVETFYREVGRRREKLRRIKEGWTHPILRPKEQE